MNYIIKKIIEQPRLIIPRIFVRLGKRCSDELYIRMKFLIAMGKPLNLKKPITFNEKLQWLKLYDHNPKYIKMVDKYEAKNYVSSIIGEEYIIPTLGVWNSFEEIDFETLPDKFVLKTTHDSGGVVICKDKKSFDYENAKQILVKSLKNNFFYEFREWPYKYVKPRIIAETYLEDFKSESLTDYKIHNFHGEPKIILTCKDRFSTLGLAEDFYTANWEYLKCKRPNHRNNGYEEAPKQLEKLLALSKQLSKDIPFIRADFYIHDNKILFGELTLYPAAGLSKFVPEKYDYLFGSWLDITGIKTVL